MPRAFVGGVTINPDGTDSGTGLSWEMYVEQRDREAFANPASPPSGWPGTQAEWSTLATTAIVASKGFFARQAIAYATALVPYLRGYESYYSLVWRGPYAGATSYHAGDLVRHDEALFMALVETQDNPPRTNDVIHADWDFVYGSPHDHLKFGVGPYPTLGKLRIGPWATATNREIITIWNLDANPSPTNFIALSVSSAGTIILGGNGIAGSYTQAMDGVHTFWSGDLPRLTINANYSIFITDLIVYESKRIIHGTIDNSGYLIDGYEISQTKADSDGLQAFYNAWVSNPFPVDATIIVEGTISADRNATEQSATTSFHAKFRTSAAGVLSQKSVTVFGQPFVDGSTVEWQVQPGAGGQANRVVVRFKDNGFVWSVRVTATVTITR